MNLARSGLACALPALLFAAPASAQVAGGWKVSGKIGDTPFAVDCQFQPQGAALGGVCVDEGVPDARIKPKSHTLAKGAVAGRQVSWSYPANLMMFKFQVAFTGVLDGDRMSGTVDAGGRKGEFTAARK